MSRHWLALILTVVVLPAACFAQTDAEVTGDDGLFADENKNVVTPEDEVANPAGNPADVDQTVEFTKIRADQLAWLLERVTLLSERQIALEEENRQLKLQLEDVEILTAKLATLEAQLADVGNMARREADEALGRMADDPVLRTEFGRQLQGKLNLNNQSGIEKVIYINGTAWTVRTGESYIYVPVGKVSIQETKDAQPKFIDLDQWTTDAGQMVASYLL